MGLGLGLRYRGQNLGGLSSCTCHSRRDVLAGLGAMGAAAAFWPAAAGQPAGPATRIAS